MHPNHKSLLSNEQNVTLLLEKLEKGVQQLFNSAEYKNYLNTMSRFHHYSPSNILLILKQSPDATYVAGYRTWQTEFHRHVQKGEKAIYILAPMHTKKWKTIESINPQGESVKEQVLVEQTTYKLTTIYDISQTKGQPLPTIVKPLLEDVTQFPSIVDAIKELSPVPIRFAELKDCNGYFSYNNQEIVIKENLSQSHQIKTMIHELAHALIHDPKRNPSSSSFDKRTKEIQAESVAYVVCNHFGIDSSTYSFGYITTWSSNKELKELKNSLAVIQQNSNYCISNLEKLFLQRNIDLCPKKENINENQKNQQKEMSL